MPDRDKTQDQILSAAAEVIIRLGYDKTTMSDIAEEAGTSRRTVYLYFNIVEMLSYGQLTIGDFKPPDQFPPYDAVMEALAEIMDRALLPEDGGNCEAGKALFRQITAAARAQMEQIKQAMDMKQTPRQEATHDSR